MSAKKKVKSIHPLVEQVESKNLSLSPSLSLPPSLLIFLSPRTYLSFRICVVVVELAFHDVYAGADSLEVVVHLLRADVPRAQDVLHFPWQQDVLELLRQVARTVRNMKVAKTKYEHH